MQFGPRIAESPLCGRELFGEQFNRIHAEDAKILLIGRRGSTPARRRSAYMRCNDDHKQPPDLWHRMRFDG
jgi:hypothetical protein